MDCFLRHDPAMNRNPALLARAWNLLFLTPFLRHMSHSTPAHRTAWALHENTVLQL